MAIITLEFAMALKTDVHLCVIYSTWPVSTRSIWLSRPSFSYGLLFRPLQALRSAPLPTQHSSSCAFYVYISHKTGRNLCLGLAGVHNCQAQMGTNFCTYTATCWASYNAQLFSVWPTTLKSMSLCPPYFLLGIITDFILTWVFNYLMLSFIW